MAEAIDADASVTQRSKRIGEIMLMLSDNLPDLRRQIAGIVYRLEQVERWQSERVPWLGI